MNDSVIADIRAFNRFYTRQIGLLNEHVAESRFSLAEGRVLYEIAARHRTTGGELAATLRLDPAYLSRLLQKFSALGLIALTPNPDDRRSNQIALTPEGDAAVAELGDLNDAAVAGLLAPIDAAGQQALVAAMRTIRTVLGDTSPPSPVLLLRPHRIGELGWMIHRQGLLYNQQFGWDVGFESLIAGIYNAYQEAPDSPPKALWVADAGGAIAGSVFVIPFDGSADTAQLRMLYVEPSRRGRGIGTSLVAQAVAFARDGGYRRLKLWTQENLVAARKIYAAAGFALVASEPHHSFGKDLVSEFWELEL